MSLGYISVHIDLSVCVAEWLGHAPSCFTAHEFDGSRVQIPGADTFNQAVHPSGVGKLVANSMQWVTAVEDCEGKRAALRWLVYVWTMQPDGANYHTPVSCS
jgi:hypothetical protein